MKGAFCGYQCSLRPKNVSAKMGYRMRARHELWKEKYPDSTRAHGPAFTGLSNARPETKALAKPPVDLKKLPFDPLEYIHHELPFDVQIDPGLGE